MKALYIHMDIMYTHKEKWFYDMLMRFEDFYADNFIGYLIERKFYLMPQIYEFIWYERSENLQSKKIYDCLTVHWMYTILFKGNRDLL